MRAHVGTLVDGLGRDQVVGKFSLRDIYGMIAGMHAENQQYLSRSVLAFALGIGTDELEGKALRTLRREAMLDPGDNYVLTRHRRIAEAACTVMREDNDNIDRWYSFLARAARLDFKNNRTGDPYIADWTFHLSEHFAAKGERGYAVARSVAKAVYDAEPENAPSLTAYCSILRQTKRAVDGMAVLKAADARIQRRRDVLHEWSTVARGIGDHGLAAWLGGRSVSDRGEPLGPHTCKFSLAGLGFAFHQLFAEYGNRVFAIAEAACGHLGLKLPDIDTTARGLLEGHANEGRRNGVADLPPEKSVEAVREATILGSYEAQPVNDPEFYERLIGEPDSYRYTALLALASGSGPTASRSARAQDKTSRR